MIKRVSQRRTQQAETIPERLDRVLGEQAVVLRDDINDPWPENTGRSRWTVEDIGPAEFSVGSPARYAPFVRVKGASAPFVETTAPAIVAGVVAETSTRLGAEIAELINLGG